VDFGTLSGIDAGCAGDWGVCRTISDGMPKISLAGITDSGTSSRIDAGFADNLARSEKPTVKAARRLL